MQSRQSPRLVTVAMAAVLVLGLGLCAALPAALSPPASVAVESVGVAREVGWAVMHITASRPTPVQITRVHAPERLVADFVGAVLAPRGDRPIQDTPGLARLVSLSQAGSAPTVVRLEVACAGTQPPTIQRFADATGLLVRLYLPGDGGRQAASSAPARPMAAPGPLVASAGSLTLVAATPASVGAVVRAASAPWRDLFPRYAAGLGADARGPFTSAPGPLPEEGARVLLAALPGASDLCLPAQTPPEQAAALPQVVVSAPAMTTTPPSLVAARPRPEGTDKPAAKAEPELQKVRVVTLDPLCVAIDCSRPLMYRIGKLESPARYVVTFPGATVAPTCVRAVALHPAREGSVSVEEGDQGATVIIPAAEGDLCSARPGAYPQTILCELARARTATLVAERPGPATGGAATSEQRPAEALINVDFQDAPVVEILTALARYADKNIITTPEVTGNMSVSLTQVTLTEALDLIVALNNLEYVLVGDRNYVVGTGEEIARLRKISPAVGMALPLELLYRPQNTTPQRVAQELTDIVKQRGVTIKIVEDAKSMVFMNVPDEATLEWLREHATQVDVPPQDTTRWIRLDHLAPTQAESALQGLTPKVQVRLPGPEAGRVAVIGLSGKSVDVDEAEQILTTIDVAPPAGAELAAREEAVARTLRVSYVDPEAIVTLITSMYGEQVQAFLANSTRDIADAVGSQEAGGLRPAATIVIRGPESALAAVEQLVAQVDLPPPQVQITATITEITADKEGNVGASWTLPGLIVSEQSTAGGGFNFGKIIRGAWNSAGAGSFQAQLNALLKTTNSTILSRTKLVAVNGKSADFLVGDIIPYEVSVAGDGTVTRSVEFENIGLELKFSPTVDTKDQITIFLAPEVRTFTGFTPQGYPMVATREAKTIVRVSDGDIIVIGGLLRDEELKTLSGIPFLKDIPLFGELFRQRQTTKKKSEIVVFAEVELLRPGEAPASGEPAAGEG